MTVAAIRNVSRRLNQECFCITVDHAQLRQEIAGEIGDAQQIAALMAARPHLFCDTPVFLPAAVIDEMLLTVRSIEAVARLPAYRQTVLSWAPDIAGYDPGPLGAFMGYDFHVTDGGPKLIEINSNAGGAFLNAQLVRAQSACCSEVEAALHRSGESAFEDAVVRMFEHEWRAQGRAGRPLQIAIVDDEPAGQYLYPEFLLAQRLLQRHGFQARIADAGDLRYQGGRLLANGVPLDLVYNRLCDFGLDRPEHAALRAAYLDGSVVVTPNPRVHALLADKRNLTLLSDPQLLRSSGASDELLAALGAVPRTIHVTAHNARQLWQTRKDWFFKPVAGYGSKAVYRGAKLTTSVWAEIARGGFIAQQFAEPGERMIRIDGELQTRKVDVRLYTYRSQLLLSAARVYQGQTTNFRTPGGGFAPLLAL